MNTRPFLIPVIEFSFSFIPNFDKFFSEKKPFAKPNWKYSEPNKETPFHIDACSNNSFHSEN